MDGLNEYLIPYAISQAVSLIILIIAWKSARWARWLFSIQFLWASGINMYLGLTDPDSYLDNARFAIPFSTLSCLYFRYLFALDKEER